MNTIKIQAFTFLQFMQEVQNAIISGYRLDFESNDNCPQRFGNTYEAGMTKVCTDAAIAPTKEQLEAMSNLAELGQEIDSESYNNADTKLTESSKEVTAVKQKAGRPKKGGN